MALPQGRVKVTGVIENQAWRERHEAQKKARAARMQDPAFRAKYEARKEAQRQREEAQENAKQAKIAERVREKMLHETYKQLGIEENYIQNKQAEIDAARAKNPVNPAGSLGSVQRKEQIAKGAGGAAAADGREMRGFGKDIALTAGSAAIAAAGGLEAVAAPIIGEAAFAAIMETIGVVAGASFFGPAVAIGTIAILTRKMMKKAKARKANQADQSQKLDDWQADLDLFKKQLDTVQSQLVASQDMLVEKYQSMKKGEFNAYLKSYISELLAAAGLTADKEAAEAGVENMIGSIEAQANKQEEASAPETDAPEAKGSQPDEPAQEDPSVGEPEQTTPGGEEMEETIELDEFEAPTISAISLDEITAEKEEMMAEGVIENLAEKEAQIQEQIQRMKQEEQVKTNELHSEVDRSM